MVDIFNSSHNFYELHLRSVVGSFREGMTETEPFLSFQRFRLHDMIWDHAKSLSSSLLSAMAFDEGSLHMDNGVRHLFFWLGRGRSRHNTLRGIGMESLGSSVQLGQSTESLDPREDRANFLFLTMHNRVSQFLEMNYLRTLVLKQFTFYHIGLYKFTYLRAPELDSCKDSGCISARLLPGI